jgi:MHS family proline/betaine transporter-like MFS transporter
VLPTFLLGCLPTYQQAGIAAPILLVIIRLIQGLSVGGEFSSSVTYLVETADKDRRGISGSWANTGSIFGMMLGAGVSALVTSVFSADSISEWGWRLPFLFGGIIGIISIQMRRQLPRSKHFQRHHAERGETSPLLEAFTTNRRQMILAITFASAYGVMFYLPVVYLPEWLHSETGMPRHQALQINTAATVILLLLIPVSGWIGDHLLRRTHFIAASMLLLALVGWPLSYWLAIDGLVAAIIVQLVLIIFLAVPLGSAPAMFAELFPARDRLSGYSVAYNLGLGVIGGTTPMLSTWLIKTSGYSTAPAIYLVLMAAIAFITLLLMRDRSREALR